MALRSGTTFAGASTWSSRRPPTTRRGASGSTGSRPIPAEGTAPFTGPIISSLELNISVLNAALRGEGTGAATGFRADTVAVAKRDLRAGDLLDGEGGRTVWGRIMPAADSLARQALPIGLAHDVRLTRAVGSGEVVTRDAVALDESDPTVRIRREMERMFASNPEGG